MDRLGRDLRLGLRRLGRDRAFSATVVLTLALCIAANTALFAVVYNVLLRPLPVPDPERVLLMGNLYPGAGVTDSPNSGIPDYYDRLEAMTALEGQALFRHDSPAVGESGFPTRIRVADVTPSYFRVMPVRPLLGRTFTEDEGEPGNDGKLLLSETLWRRLFGGDPGAVGQDLLVDGEPLTVIGVLPRSLEPLDPGVLAWRPLAFSPEDRSDDNRHSNNYWHVGRLRPGATLEQAQAQVDALNAANLERFPQFREILTNAGFHTRVVRLQDYLVRNIRPVLLLLWGGAALVLLIGSLNVLNLVVVRARARLKELVTRLALGAGRGDLARSLVVESTVLSVVAAGIGLALAALALRSLAALHLEELPYGAAIGIDGTVVVFVALLSVALGAVLGLVPLAHMASTDLSGVLREEGRSTSGGPAARALRRALVVTQVAFTFVLLAGASLLLASLGRVLDVDPGFASEGVLTATVSLPESRYKDEHARRAFVEEALRRVREIPGAASVGATDTIPFGDRHSDSVIFAEGYAMKPGESVISPASVDVSPGYLETIGARLVRGRFFEERDASDALRVAIVDRKLAERFWPGEDPLGRRMYRPSNIEDLMAIGPDTRFYTVVGVVEDLRLTDLTDGERTVGTYFFPFAQDDADYVTLALRSTARPSSMAGPLRTAIASLDPELPVFDVRTMEERVDGALVHRRAPALLSLAFGVVALLLSAVGLYGVLVYLVAQRAREIAIRIAIGSTARGVFALVFREGAILVTVGLLAGAAGSLLLRRSMEGLLFGIRSTDPVVIGAAVGVLVFVALLACTVPARRATRIDPVSVLGA